uniref:Endochitinase 2 (Fragments) n=1 Tax=Capsicum chinense TaxID=80379 RepID=CHI2_CAPCH|nr:RecName: Full=Endochitinase 2 [Capsicum chinense]
GPIQISYNYNYGPCGRYCGILGVSPGDNLDCGNQR